MLAVSVLPVSFFPSLLFTEKLVSKLTYCVLNRADLLTPVNILRILLIELVFNKDVFITILTCCMTMHCWVYGPVVTYSTDSQLRGRLFDYQYTMS